MSYYIRMGTGNTIWNLELENGLIRIQINGMEYLIRSD